MSNSSAVLENPENDTLVQTFSANRVDPSVFDIVIDLGVNDQQTDLPLIHISDYDMYENQNGNGAIRATTNQSLEGVGSIFIDNIMSSPSLIEDQRVIDNLQAIRMDVIQAVDRYLSVTEDHTVKELVSGWKEEIGLDPLIDTSVIGGNISELPQKP